MGCPESVVLPSADPERSQISGTPGRKIRVLVVDDDPRVRTAIAQTVALEADLILAAEASDATTALSMAAQTRPSVALVDVALPDSAAGLGLVRLLAHHPGCAVVAMSIHGGLREPALMAGADHFVEKNGDIEAVLTAVRSTLTLTI
jgi:two-component system, NarL family, response regulator DesR